VTKLSRSNNSHDNFSLSLAAPLVAAGIGGVMSGIGLGATAAATYLGALASSGALVGALFGAYGGKMTGEMMESYAKEVSDVYYLKRLVLRYDRSRTLLSFQSSLSRRKIA